MFEIQRSHKFIEKTAHLPEDIWKKLAKALRFLTENPRHPSLRTHKVENAFGFYSNEVFEAYVDIKYRLTWEYKEKGVIYLRNIGNHDDCLRDP